MSTSVVPAETYMGLSPSQVQEFSSHVMSAEIFGAFLIAFETRRAETGMTQAQLAERLGKDKTGTSKLLSAPRNWTIRTISDLSVALNVIAEISLHDRIEPTRVFTSTGVSYKQFPTTSFPAGGQQIGSLTGATPAITNEPLNPSGPIGLGNPMSSLVASAQTMTVTS